MIRAPGLYGKLTDQRDFVRVNSGAFVTGGLDRWFSEAVEALRTERLVLPPEPTRFLLAASGGSPGFFVGAYAPSADAVGRQFPLVVFVEAAREELATTWAALPVTGDGFWAAAGALAAVAGTLTSAAAPARLTDLAPFIASGVDVPAVLAASSAEPLAQALGGPWLEVGPYALRTITTALAQASTGAHLVLDCPAPDGDAAAFWLALIAHRAEAQGLTPFVPSLFWQTDVPAPGKPRLLVALGVPPAQLLCFIVNTAHRSNKLWPLRTAAASARTAAADQMDAARASVFARPSTLGSLLGALTSA